jgi:hypothetical protein
MENFCNNSDKSVQAAGPKGSQWLYQVFNENFDRKQNTRRLVERNFHTSLQEGGQETMWKL